MVAKVNTKRVTARVPHSVRTLWRHAQASEGAKFSSEQLSISAAYSVQRNPGVELKHGIFESFPSQIAEHQQHKTGLNECSMGT